MRVSIKIDLYLDLELSENTDRGTLMAFLNEPEFIPNLEKELERDSLRDFRITLSRKLKPVIVTKARVISKRHLLAGTDK